MWKNFTIWSDYGASNISLRTAIDLYRDYDFSTNIRYDTDLEAFASAIKNSTGQTPVVTVQPAANTP